MFVPFPERLFGKAWREEFVVLYEDSSVIWFRDRDRLDPEGGIFLKDAPEMLAAGQVRTYVRYCRTFFMLNVSRRRNWLQRCKTKHAYSTEE